MLANHVNVPFLMVGYNKLEIRDGAAEHLTVESSRVFTESLLKQLENEDDFKNLIAEKNKINGSNTTNNWNKHESFIKILSATYGNNVGCQLGNASLHVKAACEGRTDCDFAIDVQMLGDFAPGKAKDFVVKWQCSPQNEVFTKTAPAGVGFKEVITLSCPAKNLD